MYQAEGYTFEFTEAEKEVFRRKPPMTVSRWAEHNRVVVRGPKKGPWTNAWTPYMAKVMDTFNDPWVQKIVLVFAPQTAKTSGVLNMLMYAVDYDPEAALYVMPDEKTAKRIVRRQVIPTLKASPVIRKLLSPRADDVTTLSVKFQNGMDLTLAWATSAAELASESYRYVFFDETGKYPKMAGREGDPVYLGEIRTTAYPDTRKIVYFSTPNEEDDAIMRAKAECDQHFIYLARCPACGHLQEMKFRRYTWPDVDWRTIKRKKLARYQCENCPIEWDDHMRNRAVDKGMWQTDDDIDRPLAVSFTLPAYYSKMVSLSDTAAAYLQGKGDPAKMKIFVTQHKAQPYKQVIERAEESGILQARCNLAPQTAPEEAVALSAGVDVQKLGFWFVVRAWARDFTSWLIHYGFLPAWEDVEKLLFDTAYPVGDTKKAMRIWRAAIDTGGGKKYADMSMTEETYWWIRINGVGRGCRVYGTKGSSRPLAGKLHTAKPLDKTPSGKPLPGGLQLITLDTDKVKDMVFYRLHQAAERGAYAAYLHKDAGKDYARQITAEEKQKQKNGAETWVAVRKDNHLLDAECLCHIVVDPEWPGGGLNLLQNNPPARAKIEKPQAPPNWISHREFERPSWLSR